MAAEQLHQVREELSRTEAECDEKRSRLQENGSGNEVLKGDEVFHKHIRNNFQLKASENQLQFDSELVATFIGTLHNLQQI